MAEQASPTGIRHASRATNQLWPTWRRLGEIEAEAQDCAAYHENRFRNARLIRLEHGRNPEEVEAVLAAFSEGLLGAGARKG